MSYILAQIFLCLLVAALLGMVIGWMLCRSGCKKQSNYIAPEDDYRINTAVASTTPSAGHTAVSKESKKEDELAFINTNPSKYNAKNKDNLQLIKGVGKTLEKVLNDMGVFKFEQIASWTTEQASKIDEVIAFPGRIEREGWVAQCKDLAKGKTTEFSKRVEKGEVPTSNA